MPLMNFHIFQTTKYALQREIYKETQIDNNSWEIKQPQTNKNKYTKVEHHRQSGDVPKWRLVISRLTVYVCTEQMKVSVI